MREILFRGRKPNGEWVEGGIWIENDETYIISKVRYIPDTRDWDTLEYYEKHLVYKYGKVYVDSKTIGQYTGVKDKNDNKIFEGDIVKLDDSLDTKQKNFEVKFAYGQFYIGINKPLAYASVRDSCDIIGNIHDNPELLRGE